MKGSLVINSKIDEDGSSPIMDMLAGLGSKRDYFVGISIVGYTVNTAAANSHVADRIWLNQSSKLYHS
jgi:hypothetical protein